MIPKQYSLSERLIKASLILLVLSYHVIPIFAFLFKDIRLFGKNILIIVPMLFFGFGFLFYFRKLGRGWQFFVIGWFALFFCLTTIAIALYDYDTLEFFNRRFFLVPLLILLPIFKLLQDPKYRDGILKLFIAIMVVQCFLGILHNIFFSQYWYFSDGVTAEYIEMDINKLGNMDARTRETGTLLSSSLFGYVMLTGIMVLIYVKKLPWGLRQPILNFGVVSYLFYGLLLCGSRGPISIAVMIIATSLLSRNIIRQATLRVLFITIIISVLIYIDFDEIMKGIIVDRTLASGTGGRYEKLLIMLTLLGDNLYLWVGAPSFVVAATQINGVYLSDNSYALLLVTFGIFALIPITVFLSIAWQYARATKTFFPVLSGIFCLGTTNAILWEPWVFYYSIALALILYSGFSPLSQRDNKMSTSPIVEKNKELG